METAKTQNEILKNQENIIDDQEKVIELKEKEVENTRDVAVAGTSFFWIFLLILL